MMKTIGANIYLEYKCFYMTATFTFEALPDESPQHLSTVVTERGRFVGVDVKSMRSDLEIFHCSLSWNQNAT